MASSQRFRRAGVASVPTLPGVGVASHLLTPPGVASTLPGVAPNSSGRPGVASQRPTAGVACGSSHSDTRAFFLLQCHTHITSAIPALCKVLQHSTPLTEIAV